MDGIDITMQLLQRDAPYVKGSHGTPARRHAAHLAGAGPRSGSRRLGAVARSSGVEVLHTIIQSLTLDGRDRSLDHKLTPIYVAPDAPEGLPVAELAPVGDEILLPKTSSGVFNSTNLDYLLKNLGIRHLVVVGILADQCVDTTVRDDADRGYLVTCITDACAAPTSERHDTALRAFGGYCWLADTDTTEARLRELGKGSAP